MADWWHKTILLNIIGWIEYFQIYWHLTHHKSFVGMDDVEESEGEVEQHHLEEEIEDEIEDEIEQDHLEEDWDWDWDDWHWATPPWGWELLFDAIEKA